MSLGRPTGGPSGADSSTETDPDTLDLEALVAGMKASPEALQRTIRGLEERVARRTAELEAEIRERQRAEASLRESENRLRELIEQASDGIFIADLEGRYTDVNTAGCRMLGFTRDEILHKTITDLIPPEDVDRLWRTRDHLLQGGANVAEWIIHRRDGTALPIEVSDTILSDGRWVAFVRDISDRKRLEAEVARRSEQLAMERNFVNAVLDTAATLILVVDTQGRVVRFNRACEAATGHRITDLEAPWAWVELVPEEERGDVLRMAERLAGGKESVHHENHWRHRDGSTRLIHWRNTVLKDDVGRVQYVIGTGVDITEQRRAEDEARRHLEEASRLQRLQTANELATVLAHELNQPLAAIATYAEATKEVLRHPPPNLDRLMENLDRISQQALRAGETIRHLRSFISRGEIDPGAVDLNAVVSGACELMAPKARNSGARIVTDLAPTLPPVLAVDVHVEQVLLNLLRNAIEAIRDSEAHQGTITVSTGRADDMAVVSVRDTGPGIEPRAAATLFEPLSSRKEYGLGVGLRISRSLVEAHGGRLWVEPQTPGGVLHFTLPFAP